MCTYRTKRLKKVQKLYEQENLLLKVLLTMELYLLLAEMGINGKPNTNYFYIK